MVKKMKKTARSILNDIRRASNALAYAHTGEMLSINNKYNVLAESDVKMRSEQTPPVQTSLPAASKHVLLAFSGQVQSASLCYAMKTATRHDAQLDILTDLNAAQLKKELFRVLGHNKIEYNVIKQKTDLLDAIATYTESHPDVLFVVTSSQDTLTERYVETRSQEYTFQTPWLVIADELCIN